MDDRTQQHKGIKIRIFDKILTKKRAYRSDRLSITTTVNPYDLPVRMVYKEIKKLICQ